MQYFKHFGTMRHDVKIKRVIYKYGLEGYGLYNLTLESITESLSTDSPLPDLQETCEDIAEFYNGNTAKINEIMNFMVNQGLFDLNEMNGNIVCNKLYKFLDTSQTRSTELRAMITGYKTALKKSKGLIEDKSQTVTDGNRQSGTSNDKSDRKEEEKNKKENKKRKEKYNPSDFVCFFNDSDFKEVWKDYIEVRTKKKASKSDRAIRDIIKSLRTYSGDNKEAAIEIIKKSADSGWTSIYALKDVEQKEPEKKKPTFEEERERVRREYGEL